MSLAGERYLKLIEDLAREDRVENPSKPPSKEEPHFAYGWQTRVARKLGVDQSMVSKVWRGDQSASIELVELAQEKQRIRYEYFHEKKLTSPHFRAFQRGRRVPDMGYRAFNEFVESAPRMGVTLTEREIQLLGQQEWDGDPTVQTYFFFLQALRATLRPSQSQVFSAPDRTA